MISEDVARTFKPNPAVYALVEPSLGAAKHEILFVSANGFDVSGAKHFGFTVARIERSAGRVAPTNAIVSPSEFFGLLRGRAERFGQEADFQIRSFADLPPLLSARCEPNLVLGWVFDWVSSENWRQSAGSINPF